VAAALAAALLDLAADEVVGRGSSADAAMLDRKRDVVTRALERVGRVDPAEAVRRLGGGELAVLTGVALGVAESGGVVVLDGLATSVAALAAVRLEPAVAAHLVAGQRSREKAHALVLRELGLEPLLDLRIRAGEGVGAALATGLVKDALALRAGVARTSTV
jgi:nicotinate-nucleotide--dimethylbenzimidazole phosphoribosyltransferase